MSLDVNAIKSRFPIFSHHQDLVYVDNAATTQKPGAVIHAMSDFYETANANPHRGLYKLSSDATRSYEAVRSQTSKFLGAKDARSITFTKGATESINIIAQGFVKPKLRHGDNLIVTAMEHHANFIPWQQVCREKNCQLRIIRVNTNGEIDWAHFTELLDAKTKLVALTHVSNVLGTINPIKKIIDAAHEKNVPVLIDGAQAVGHMQVDVVESGVDFLAFSAHKMFGPMGVGVLYAQSKLANEIEPLNFGGGSIKLVTADSTVFMDYPAKLEAGTPNVGGVIGFGAAMEFIQSLNLMACAEHVKNLGVSLREQLKSLPFVELYGTEASSGILSFNINALHPHDVASFLGDRNIAVRAGHHCAQPLLDSLHIGACVRVSFSIYNSQEDVDAVVSAVKEAKKFWS